LQQKKSKSQEGQKATWFAVEFAKGFHENFMQECAVNT
jgi:hypothetical protein